VGTWPRFSSRLDWEVKPNRLAELVANKRAAGAPILDLTESNPTRAGIDYDGDAIRQALAGERVLSYEPHPAGLEAAREAVAAYYAERGWRVQPRQILLTAGTSEAYAFLLKLLADPGDDVLVPRPSYPLFEFLAPLEGVGLRHYRLHYDHGWWVDLESAEAAMTERTRALVVVSPNNPTGSFLKRNEQQALAKLCAERGLALIADEVFLDYAFRADPARAPSSVTVEEALCFTLNGLSKAAGLPQMKLGWIAISGPAALWERARERLELIADTYLTVATPVEQAASVLLRGARQFQARLRARLERNLAALREAAEKRRMARLLEVEGGWYAVLRLPRTRSEEDWALAFLDRDGVLVQPGYFYDFEEEAYAVVSLLPPEKLFREAVDRILAHLAGCV
jgi:alanine-synthesizing transaminase